MFRRVWFLIVTFLSASMSLDTYKKRMTLIHKKYERNCSLYLQKMPKFTTLWIYLKSKLIWKITKSKAILINKITLHHQIGTSSSSNFYIIKWITNTIKWHGHIKISFLLLSFSILKIGRSWKFMLTKFFETRLRKFLPLK